MSVGEFISQKNQLKATIDHYEMDNYDLQVSISLNNREIARLKKQMEVLEMTFNESNKEG